jgi:hypothetical protein
MYAYMSLPRVRRVALHGQSKSGCFTQGNVDPCLNTSSKWKDEQSESGSRVRRGAGSMVAIDPGFLFCPFVIRYSSVQNIARCHAAASVRLIASTLSINIPGTLRVGQSQSINSRIPGLVLKLPPQIPSPGPSHRPKPSKRCRAELG